MNDRAKFMFCLSKLIQYAYGLGYTLSGGDLWAHDGHKENSLHYRRLAIDLNLFKDGEWLKKTEDHKELGTYWESLDPKCRWGGRFQDGNHYELVPGGYKR